VFPPNQKLRIGDRAPYSRKFIKCSHRRLGGKRISELHCNPEWLQKLHGLGKKAKAFAGVPSRGQRCERCGIYDSASGSSPIHYERTGHGQFSFGITDNLVFEAGTKIEEARGVAEAWNVEVYQTFREIHAKILPWELRRPTPWHNEEPYSRSLVRTSRRAASWARPVTEYR